MTPSWREGRAADIGREVTRLRLERLVGGTWSAALLCASALMLACAQGKPPSPASDAGDESTDAANLDAASSATAAPLLHRDEAGLHGARFDGVGGDFVLRSGEHVAVIGADGRLLDFARRGTADGLSFIEPQLALGHTLVGTRTVAVRVVRAARGGGSVYVQRRFEGVTLHVHWFFVGERLVLRTRVERERDERRPLRAALRLGWGNVPAFVPGARAPLRDDEVYSAPLLARPPPLAGEPAYALGAEDTTPRGPELEIFLPRSMATGFHPTPEVRAPILTPDSSFDFALTLGADVGAASLAQPRVRASGERPLTLPAKAWPADVQVELAGCAFMRHAAPERAAFVLSPSTTRVAPLCARARLVAPGHLPTPWRPSAELRDFAPPASATLRVHASEHARGAPPRPIPARVVVRGVAPTPDPDFGDTCAHARSSETCTALRFAYGHTGTLTLALAPGRYRVLVDRGLEYTRHEEEVRLAPREVAVVRAALERVVDTTGFLSADLHLHAAPSPDAPAALEERVRAVAAVGVEVAVATDHNQVTDYAPAIARLGLREHVASVVGDEVTTRAPAWGHFNVFPLDPASAPLRFADTTPARIVAAARRARPFGARTLVQLNHPRMGELGLFAIAGFDPRAPRAFAARVPGMTLDFDLLEVWNGDDYDNLPRLFAGLDDWHALHDAGVRLTATGNSDAHKLGYHEAGLPRTFVAMPSDAPSAFDARAFVDNLRAGRALVTSGPFIQFELNGRSPGEHATPGPAVAWLRVSAAPWIDVSEVELRRGREVVRRFTVSARSERKASAAARSGGTAPSVVRLEERVRVELRAGERWMATARGETPMDGYLKPAPPFAFTNPIYVGAPGSGKARAP